LELGRSDLSTLEVVPDMHTRKRRMAELSDAFVALPGGYGTLEELFEAVTWTQLNYHLKPVGLVNVDGYYDGLIAFLARASAERIVRPDHVDLLQVATDPAELLERLARVELPDLAKWIDDV
ncbi:MAG: TIGR00730 family Rossman fold protein, partial [Myxococcota bacterium]